MENFKDGKIKNNNSSGDGWGKGAMAKEDRDETLVVLDRKGLGVEVSNIKQARGVMDSEQTLRNPIPYPVKTHVYRFRLLGPNSAGSQPKCTQIVNEHGGGGLGIAEVSKSRAERTGYLDSGKQGGILSLRG